MLKRFLSGLGEFSLRLAGFIAACAAIILTVYLVIEYTGNQSNIAIGVAMLSVFISATGGLLARSAWKRSAYAEFAMGLTMWLIGATYLGVNELGYWAQNYDLRYSRYLEAKQGWEIANGMVSRDFKALITGEAPITVAQISAQISAAELDPIFKRSNSCALVTRDDTRQFCQQFFQLKGKLAAAEKIAEMERHVNTIKTPENDAVAGNVFANAELMSRWFGGQERQWADFITIASLLVLMVMRDFGFLVAFPIGRQGKAVHAQKAEPRPDLARRRALAVSDAPTMAQRIEKGEALGTAIWQDADGTWNRIKCEPFSRDHENGPDGNGGSKTPLPDMPKKSENSSISGERAQSEGMLESVSNPYKLDDDAKIVNTDGSPYEPKPGKRHRKEARIEAAVKRFFREVYEPCEIERTSKNGWRSGGTPASQVRKDYTAWAMRNKLIVPKGSHLGRYVAAHVDVAPSATGKYYACLPRIEKQLPKRRVA